MKPKHRKVQVDADIISSARGSLMCVHVVGVSHVYIDTSLDIISTFCYGWTSREGPSKVYISRRHTSAMVGVG
jgi:hypothetical protein